jgi:hypothetical protein
MSQQDVRDANEQLHREHVIKLLQEILKVLKQLAASGPAQAPTP